ncbi:MAG TPA: ERAP1-like C-terminal domain-containing protein, partial [Microthrixaceae bacterium]|nr:ERAP1-like C-terminal domain-containing protein [Microthrixaceae bacterium]
WLNEAFATFMELSCTDAYRPDWSVWTTFGQARSGAFAIDATSHTRPIEFEVRTPSEAEAMFDVLTYEKGGSVLRMVEQHLGPEPFRRAIGTYLDRHRYSSTETADLWVALDEVSDEPGEISRVMTSWIRQGGHPLVSVERIAPDRVRIRQEHFAYRDPTRRTWSIPIGLRIAAGGTVSERRLLLTEEELTIEVDPGLDWLCANADGVGFYRTTYDDTLRAALLDSIEALAPLERFDLLDDVWGFMVAGRASIDAVIETLRALRSETHPAVLRRMSTALAELKLLGGTERGAEVAAFAASLVSDRHDTDPEVAGILLRIAGCVATTADARAEAAALLERSERGRENGSERVAAELVAAAVDVVATQGGAAEFDRFVDRYRGADTPQDELRYLAALTRFDHEDLQDRLLAMCLDEVRAQNAPFTLAQAMSNPRLGSRAWTFVRDHWDEVTARFPTSSIPRMIGGVRSIWDPVAAADIIEFFDSHPQEVGARQIAQHLELVSVQQDTLAREAGRLAAALA